jgi:hypothetical protein
MTPERMARQAPDKTNLSAVCRAVRTNIAFASSFKRLRVGGK